MQVRKERPRPFLSQRVKKLIKTDALKAPSDEGKRSDVTGVNDSPVDCQSRDRNRHSDLSPWET